MKRKIPVFFVESKDTFVGSIQASFEEEPLFEVFFFKSGEIFIDYITSDIFIKRIYSILFLSYTFEHEKGISIMNGFEVLKICQKHAPNMDIVMFTNGESIEEQSLANRLGAKMSVKKSNSIILQIKTAVEKLNAIHKCQVHKSRLKYSSIALAAYSMFLIIVVLLNI